MREFGKVISESEKQPSNALLPIELMPSDSTAFSRLPRLAKALSAIVLTPPGTVIPTSDEQSLKAPCSISVTLCGIERYPSKACGTVISLFFVLSYNTPSSLEYALLLSSTVTVFREEHEGMLTSSVFAGILIF